jgi:hypothetical protein
MEPAPRATKFTPHAGVSDDAAAIDSPSASLVQVQVVVVVVVDDDDDDVVVVSAGSSY